MTETTQNLLEGLVSLGCGVEQAEGSILVSLPDDYDEFVFEWMGGWLYLGTTFMTAEEISESAHESRLDRFLLELQDRNLGCQFSYDRAGYLSIGTVLYPNQQNPEDVLQAMEQISFVIDVCLPLCDQVLASGELPADTEINRAFGVSENLH